MNDKGLPPGWGDDDLTSYFELAYRNRFATFANKRPVFDRLIAIDSCYMEIAKNWLNPKKLMEAILFLRCHTAYREACEHAVAGQTAGVFPLVRVCLEYAGYALHMSENEGLDELWLRRHDDVDSKKAMKNEFTPANVRATIKTKNQHIEDVFKNLYDRTIDFGAHPNERSITANLTIIDQEKSKKFESVYAHGDGPQFDHALKTCAQTGIASLEIFQDIFPGRFELLGIRHKILSLRQGL